MTILLMALFGGLGAVARFVVDGELRARLAATSMLPTLAINLSGSLLLGVLAALVAHGTDPDVRLVLGTGFCGGFTTFSTAMVETVRRATTRSPLVALGWLVGSASACVLLAAAGYLLA